MRDQRARRRIDVVGEWDIVGKRGNDRLRECLAELDTPLIERVDSVEDTFDERAVLVEREERAERAGVDGWKQ